MAELEKELTSDQTADTTSTTTAEDYIEAIKALKQTTVDKGAYDSLRAENKKLLESLINGEEIQPKNKVLTEDINELRNDILFNDGLTNLDYWDKVLKLRSALLKRGDEDPFVPQGSKVNATQADYATAEKVATIMQEMVDNADGDPNVFLNEYQRRVKDTSMKK
jgi:hypothetical protein